MNTNATPLKSPETLRRKKLSLIRPRACTRCGGDLSIECDSYGVSIECIQCGGTWNRNDFRLAVCPETGAVKIVKADPADAALPARQTV